MNYNFEWDSSKAKSNVVKHKIDFDSAVSVFKDKDAISIFDDEHSENEDRWVTIGMDCKTRRLVVVHTFIALDKDNCNVRVISARKATKNEQKIYMEQ
ncbi:MAG: BrnT family toxin [Sulfuricurvum sp.]|nr:BrnT family toxin [Sulfuricurvum sp.]MDD5385844.1 BrnT family toxin [Sulfuricurvum sp.]